MSTVALKHLILKTKAHFNPYRMRPRAGKAAWNAQQGCYL
jgi:hypothetical protein